MKDRNREIYYVYCKGILGVKTNLPGFSWVYGSVAPEATVQEYEACAVKLEVSIVPERMLAKDHVCDKQFQSYGWNNEAQRLTCRRTLLRAIELGYDIRLEGNTAYAQIGENYYRLIKNRTMNLHGMYYLLADLANIMLLKNGYLTLYASAVFCNATKRSVLHFAPPSTGKSVTARILCAAPGYQLVGEDVVITDGQRLFACPWTCSQRKKGREMDSAGALGRVRQRTTAEICHCCELTYIAALSLGKLEICESKEEVLGRVCTLNGYLFQYYSSPVVKLLAYFSKEYAAAWSVRAEQMLTHMVKRSACAAVQCQAPEDFAEIIRLQLAGEMR